MGSVSDDWESNKSFFPAQKTPDNEFSETFSCGYLPFSNFNWYNLIRPQSSTVRNKLLPS